MAKQTKRFKPVLMTMLLSLLLCVCVAGICVGCGGKHTHAYTDWGSDAEQHWKVCPEDGAIDESSKADHGFGADGKCECGATENAKYGTVTGSVKLKKAGGYAAATDVTVDMGDDDVSVDGKTEGDKYTFTVSDIKVGKDYNLTVSKAGYKPYTAAILLEEEGEEAKIGGSAGITLEYEVFGSMCGWDKEFHDMTHVNDEKPYIKFLEHEGDKTLNVLSKDSYIDVAATLKVKFDNSTHNWHTQGIVLKYQDGKHVIVRYHNGDQVNGNIQYCNELWDFKKENTLFGEDAQLNQWGENPVHTLTPAETAAIKDANGEGLGLTAVIKGGKLYVYFDGKYISDYQLPDGYADKKACVGYFAFNAANNVIFDYEISQTLPETEGTIEIEIAKPEDGTECTVTKAPVKDKYAFGEQVELTFTAPEGYKLDALTVCGEDKYNDVSENKLTVTVDRVRMEVEATFVKEEPISIDVAVKGRKLGTTTALAQNTEVKFSGIETPFTVNAQYKITGSVIKGRYTVSADGYISKEITVDENLTEIVLEYDLLENLTTAWGWGDQADFTKQNDGEIVQTNGATQWVSSKDSYQSVAITANVISGGQRQGVFIRFKGDKFADDRYVMIQKEKNEKVSWNGENNIWGNGGNLMGDVWTSYANPLTDDDIALIKEGKYEVTLVRVKNEIYVFVNGVYKDKKVLDAKYVDAECYVGLYCTDADKTEGNTRKFRIEAATEYLTSVTVTDGTAADANGTISVAPATVNIGDTVEITVNPATGYLFDKLTVVNGKGETVATTYANGKYTFIAAEAEYTVTATFKVAPANEAQATVSGVGLGNTAIDMNEKTLSFTNDSGTTATLTVNDGNVKGVLAPGTYTVSVEGFHDLTVTVGDDGYFENLDDGFKFEKVIFVTNRINEPTKNIFGEGNPVNWAADVTHASSTGKIVSTQAGKMYEWSEEEFDDVAFTVTLKSGNGNQGMIMRFNGEQWDVRLRFENTKAQWMGGSGGGEWWWGTRCIHDRWDFGSGEEYANNMSAALLEKYNGTGLKLTILRKGGLVYALIDGKIYSAQPVTDFADKKVRIAMFVENSTQGYEIPFEINTNVDEILANAGVAVGEDVIGYLGTWTKSENTLKVDAGVRGYAEFKAAENIVKESVTIKISDAVGGDQGIMYRFDNGKYIAIRYQKNNGNYKVQYTMDTVLYNDGSLKGWTDFMMNDEEKTTFDESGLDLTFVRDGKTFYTLLGDRLIDTAVLEDKYATMGGAMAIMIWDSKGAAFDYSHAIGDDATQGYVTASAAFDGDARGYSVSVDKQFFKSGESVTITIQTENTDSAWSYFPNAITVNGAQIDFSQVAKESLGANRCKYTYTVTNAIENQAIVVTVAKGTKVSYSAAIDETNTANGTITCDMENAGKEYYWNDLCTLTITVNDGYELAKIVEGDTDVTTGWTVVEGENGVTVYTYSFTVTEDINVVAHLQAKAIE